MVVKSAQEASPATESPWAEQVEDLLQQLNVSPKSGLDDAEATSRVERWGRNELERAPSTPLWRLVLEQFDDALVKILLLAAAVSFVLAVFEDGGKEEGLRAFVEPVVIVTILVLNAVVGVWQESNAENALEALKSLQPEVAKVLRGGQLRAHTPAAELVPGDIVHLGVGDKVPADCRIVSISTATLRAEQSSLTGESVSVLKSIDAVPEVDCELQSQECMLFAGTAVVNGSCYAVVTSTGMRTEMGKIQAAIADVGAADDTPLKRKLNDFGDLLAKVIFWICVVVWAINYHHFLSWSPIPGTVIPDPTTITFSLARCTYYFKIAVALAVAAIPEGLPAVITTCLALGTKKMAASNAIIRRLPSVETLGCTTVICSDKTGTLTTNQMSAVSLIVFGGVSTRTFTISGTTYNPNNGGIAGGLSGLDAALDAAADVCAICNESAIAVAAPAAPRKKNGTAASAPAHTNGEISSGGFQCVGAPTEAALVVLAEKLGLSNRADTEKAAASRADDPARTPMPITARRRSVRPVLAILEFDRKRKSMSVITRGAGRNANDLLVKGAAECVLARCSHVMLPDGSAKALDAERRRAVEDAVADMATGGLRCLALARHILGGTPLATYDGGAQHVGHAQLQDLGGYEGVESGLTFVGLVGLQDPPRPEVKAAIADCRRAGIRVMVITGDNKDTAEAICRAIGVFEATEDVSDVSLTGRTFAGLPVGAQQEVLASGRAVCISRAEPRDKQEIVRQLRALGEITAMTGDGVNDAPALKLADIGVAMGIAGTEVAKEAADMVLADDNFSTIVAAVREGRGIFDNMKAFIRYMISSNIGEVASIFLTAALGLPEGLIPVQLLWVNLVTDGPPATALSFNPPDAGVMERAPRDPREPLITTWVFVRYMVVGMYVGFATVGIFSAWYLLPSLLGVPVAADGHSTVTWQQLTHYQDCQAWSPQEFSPARSYTVAGGGTVAWKEPCGIFDEGKVKPATLSLTVLVIIEMLNALNALSEDSSLLRMPPWANPWLLVAMALSIGLHVLVLYVPMLAGIFDVVPLTWSEWQLVFLFATPVLFIDEVLKFLGRNIFHPAHPAAAKEKSA